MRRKKGKELAELEEGWNSTFCPSLIEKSTQSRPRLNTDLLSLQAGWTKQEDDTELSAEELSTNSKYKKEVKKGVKSGEINYDAHLFLKAIGTYDERSKKVTQPRRMMSHHNTSQIRTIQTTEKNEESYWEEWKYKWDFIYDFVELEKKRIEAEEKLKKRENQLLHLKSHAEGTYSTGGGGVPPQRNYNHTFKQRQTNEKHSSSDRCCSLPSILKTTHLPPSVPQLTWEEFELKLKTDSNICYQDIPWPPISQKIINIPSSSSRNSINTKDIKLLIRKALIRWHPDKFQKVLSRIQNEEERLKALHMVQEVTRRIIAEKEASRF